MKTLLLLASLFCFEAFAFDPCEFTDTYEIHDAVAAGKITRIGASTNHARFSAEEKKLIHLTIVSDGYNSDVDINEALRIFGDFRSNGIEPGSNAGEIIYFAKRSGKIALVHYWPGDNEYGTFINISKDGKPTLLATISDGYIECK